MVPTDCLMIQEPLVTRGMSLKVLLRRASASLLSPPARNLRPHPRLVTSGLHQSHQQPLQALSGGIGASCSGWGVFEAACAALRMASIGTNSRGLAA